MQTKLITNFYQSNVDIVQCSDGRTLMRFVENLTWNWTWYANTGPNCEWEVLELKLEELQALNRDLMQAKGQPHWANDLIEEDDKTLDLFKPEKTKDRVDLGLSPCTIVETLNSEDLK